MISSGDAMTLVQVLYMDSSIHPRRPLETHLKYYLPKKHVQLSLKNFVKCHLWSILEI